MCSWKIEPAFHSGYSSAETDISIPAAAFEFQSGTFVVCEFIRKSLWNLNAAVFHLRGKGSETVCNLNKVYPFPYPRWLKSNKPDIGKLSRLSTEMECLRKMKLLDSLKYNF